MIRMLLQERFDCGGPPQTGPSSRRQQDDQPCLVCVAVEFRPQSFKCCDVDRYERRLARWSFTRYEPVPCSGRRNQNDEPRNTERPSCVLHTLWQPVRQQARDHLWKEDDEHDDDSGETEDRQR
jgi:hypothetical protein